MRSLGPSLLALGLATASMLPSEAAFAQAGPSPFPTGPAGGGEDANKPAGVAEEAPKTPGLLPTTPVLPAPKSRRKQWKLLELDGYFRLRTDWFKNFSLGFSDDADLGGGPFPRPLRCSATAAQECDDDVQGANMRLELRPTFNLDESTSIHTTVDILDNVVLGGTPEGSAFDGTSTPPLGAFADGQDAPLAGSNGDRDSIWVRHAWAEVALPLGLLKFGRMPNQWGLGLMANGGGDDPIHGTFDHDADFGDAVDRVSFSTTIPGTSLRGGIASDWPATDLISNQTDQAGRGGQPWDLDDNDDVKQWVLTITRMDTPTELADKMARGLGFNWGIYFAYRTQSSDSIAAEHTQGAAADPDDYVVRGYKSYLGNGWLRAGWGPYRFEAEAVGVIGSIDSLDDAGLTDPVDIRQLGGVGRFTFDALDGKLTLGAEVGYASGDQWDGTPQGSIHVSDANLLGGPGDTTLSRFVFDRDYKVDLILFRELMGAVSNATYVKPSLRYELSKAFEFKVWNVTSFANKPVATPGNGGMWGIEFDADLGYRSGGFFGGLSYGVLFPLSGMNHPSDNTDDGGAGFGYGTGNLGDAGTAHTIQSRLVLSF
ncbi:MAG: TIGR04551 family protein [Kofleriaceae bacterium]|nr:TIGR04551 family protein [Kofleriaceae bacterium]MBP6841640.1 TIGR04551 family protein [Kofleriaceae bacterium]MBP9203813.1 TIGR04551 family protein [Kofleriaceae bacterium]